MNLNSSRVCSKFKSIMHVLLLTASILSAAPPGRSPFSSKVLRQPVPGAPRGVSPDGWKTGKLCSVSAANGTNATAALQGAIDECGDLPGGGTVLVTGGVTLLTASLWLRSNLTFRVEAGSTLLGTATGSGSRMACFIYSILKYD